MTSCNIHILDYILCKNLTEVKKLLIDEGYDADKLNSPREVYHYVMIFLKDAGDRAEKSLLALHPDKDILLDAFCPKPKQEKASNYSDEKPTVTLKLKTEHYIVLVLLFFSLVILFKG